jgi:hypothetical protein
MSLILLCIMPLAIALANSKLTPDEKGPGTKSPDTSFSMPLRGTALARFRRQNHDNRS